MNFRGIGALALALLLPLAGAANAQEQTVEQEQTAVAAEFVEKLNLLGEALGIDVPLFPTGVLTEAFEAALPVLPAGDGRDWGSTLAFDFKTDVTTDALEPDAEGRTVLTDARACSAVGEAVEVVHFTRFTRGPVRGHRCIISARVNESAALQSLTFAEGPDRRLEAYYGVAISVAGEPDEARRLLEERLDQNVALAGTLADYALEMFLSREAGTTANAEAFDVSVGRMTERLAEIAASLDSPASEPPAP
jgi:hypothetical protein